MDLFVKKDRDDLPGRLRRSQVRGPRLVRVRVVASRRQPPAGAEPHIWGRVFGQHGLQRCAANLEKDVDYDTFAVQVGMDLYYAEGPDGGSDRAGICGAIGNASGEAHLFDVSVGSNDNDAYTVGGYWTHYGRQGWYVDAIL
jgi:outer membrane autotransporter protein